jgi:RNA polymerase sigma factor (sigma-70 family)
MPRETAAPRFREKIEGNQPRAAVVSIDFGNHRKRVRARRDALIEEHVDLVLAIARRVKQSIRLNFEFEDLIGAGNVALVNAATRYSPERHGDTPFSAYARKAVRGAMIECVRRKQYREQTRPGIDEACAAAAPCESIETCIDRGRLWGQINAAVAALPPRQRKVLTGYYGADSPTMAQVSKRMGIGLMQAYYIHSQAIDGVRSAISAEAV